MKKIILLAIQFYQQQRHVLTGAVLVPTTCKFYPSCSEYAKEAVESDGALKGSIKAIKRILKCNPFI